MKLPVIAVLLSTGIAAVCGATGPDSTSFQFPEYAGRQLRFVSPVDGQEVVAGDSLVISLSVADGCEIELVLVAVAGRICELHDPFTETIRIDEAELGTVVLTAVGRTVTGEIAGSYDVSVEVVTRAGLVGIFPFSHQGRIHGIGCVSSLVIFGRYADGVERDLTELGTSYSVVAGSDIVCVTADGVVVGRRPGEAVVRVGHGGHELELPFLVGDGDCPNNTPQVGFATTVVCGSGQETCLQASQVRDFDECIGEALDPDRIHWKLESESGITEGRGYEFCFRPEKPGDGLLTLKVTDSHGASAWTMSVVEIR